MGKFNYNINLDIENLSGTQTNLTTNKVRNIVIGFKKETNLGKGLARDQWLGAFGNLVRYNEFIYSLDANIQKLVSKYGSKTVPGTSIPRIQFGTLDNTLNNKDVLQL